MDAHDRMQLHELIASQKLLREQMASLDQKIAQLQSRLESPEIPEIKEAGTPSTPSTPPPLPKLSPTPPPPPTPPIPPLAPSPILPEDSTPTPEPAHLQAPEPEPSITPLAPAAATKADTTAPSFEIEIGRVWLVRIGIAILITGLVFLGNYLVGKIGPIGKLLLLYATGISLSVLGAKLERTRESLRNYSRVLLAGGLATIYYTTYAAHFVSSLRVIESPLLAGLLLLGLAAGIVFLAERKQSQTLAIFAVLLSYYTSAINPIEGFTLYSNLLLTLAAVYFLVRNHWTAISLASLLATYLSYGYWQFFRAWQFPFHWNFTPTDFWHGTLFLSTYFTLFTAATFLCNYEGFSRGKRTAFLSLNNAAFFFYVAPYVAQVYPEHFWSFALALGGLFLGLSAIATRYLKDDPFIDAAYLAQGLLLVTLGVVTKLEGYQLALFLVVESAVLIACCRERHDWLWQTAASLCAVGALGLALDMIYNGSAKALLVGGTCCLIFLFNGRWVKHLTQTEAKFSPRAAFYCSFALILGAALIWDQTSAGRGEVLEGWLSRWDFHPQFALTLSIAAGILTFSLVLHGLIELAVLSQAYVIGSLCLWLLGPDSTVAPWWEPALILVITLGVAHRWKHSFRAWAVNPLEVLYGAGIVALLHVWLHARVQPDSWILVTAGVAAILLIYGRLSGFRCLGALGQWFVVVCGFAFFDELAVGHPSWELSILSIGIIAALGWAIPGILPPDHGEAGTKLTFLYRLLAFVMFIKWGFVYIAPTRWFLFFTFSGLILFIASVLTKNQTRLIFSGILALTGISLFWFGHLPPAPWSNLTAIVLLLGAQQFAKKSQPAAYKEVQQGMILIGLASLWLLVSRWVPREGGALSLTLAWTAVAAVIFAGGIGLRERLYRLFGLTVLACAIGRIFLVDVWQLGSLTRILSFIVLGVVLLLVGFLYNRLADKFRDWL